MLQINITQEQINRIVSQVGKKYKSYGEKIGYLFADIRHNFSNYDQVCKSDGFSVANEELEIELNRIFPKGKRDIENWITKRLKTELFIK